MSNKSLTKFLFVILLVLVIFNIQFGAFRNFVPNLSSDNAIYAILTERFYRGDFSRALHIWWQPLFPFIGSLLMGLGLNAPDSLFAVSLIAGILIFAPIFFLTHALTKSWFYSTAVGLMVSFNPKLIGSYFQLLTENLYVLLFSSAVLFSYLYLSQRKKLFIILAGLIFSLAYLTRADILLPMQIFAVSVFILFIFKKINVKKLIIDYLLFGITFILIIFPYLVFNYQSFGYLNLSAKLNASLWMPAYFAPQNNMTTTYSQEVWSVDTPNYDSRYFNEKFDFGKYRTNIIEGTRDRLRAYYKVLKSENSNLEVSLFFFGFILSFFYFLKFNRAGLFLMALIPLNFFLSVPFHPGVDIRYLFWAYPLLVLFVVMGLFLTSKLIWNLADRFRFKNIGVIVVVLINTWFIVLFYNHYHSSFSTPVNKISEVTEAYKIVGKYIKEISPNKTARILYRREALGYYSGGMLIYIPTSIGTEELKNYAAHWQADFLVADSFTFAPETPLGYLTDEKKAPEWLIPIRIWDGNIAKTILYKFEP